MDDLQKPSKPSKKAGSKGYDPARTLDPVSRRILQIEIANPDASAQQIKKLAGLELSLTVINEKRRAGLYQKVLADYQMGAINLLVDTQSRAVRKLRDQIDHADPRIAQRAALFFAETARDMQLKRAEVEYEREIASIVAATPQRHEVKVIMDGISILGQPIPTDADSQPSAQCLQANEVSTNDPQDSETVDADDRIIGNPF